MNRWLIIVVCGFAGVPALAQVPDPGTIASKLSAAPSPVAGRDGGSMLAEVSRAEMASSMVPASATPAANPDDGNIAVQQPIPVATTLPTPATPPPVANQNNGGSAVQQPSPVAAPSPAPVVKPAGPTHHDENNIRDTLGPVSIRPMPDVAEELPPYFQQVVYLRKHNDNIQAIAYLRKVVTNGDILPQYRARAILELADCLDAQNQKAESLCWLKIWMQLYPARPEIGAVAYRIGTLYTQMGLPNLARDAYYLALAHSVNDGQVKDAEDLKRYTRLTVGTLWALAANEYQSGEWARAAELFARFRKEATSASGISMEKAAFLQADCYYQLKQMDNAMSLYEETLQQHPFNPLAPEARLRLYHLYVLKNAPEKASEELQSLAWTVRTVWPKEETYWQKQTANLLLALHQKDTSVLPPLLQQSSCLPPEGKTWQETLNHYDALVSYHAGTTHATMASSINSSTKTDVRHGLPEEEDLLAMGRYLNQLLPPQRTASTQ